MIIEDYALFNTTTDGEQDEDSILESPVENTTVEAVSDPIIDSTQDDNIVEEDAVSYDGEVSPPDEQTFDFYDSQAKPTESVDKLDELGKVLNKQLNYNKQYPTNVQAITSIDPNDVLINEVFRYLTNEASDYDGSFEDNIDEAIVMATEVLAKKYNTPIDKIDMQATVDDKKNIIKGMFGLQDKNMGGVTIKQLNDDGTFQKMKSIRNDLQVVQELKRLSDSVQSTGIGEIDVLDYWFNGFDKAQKEAVSPFANRLGLTPSQYKSYITKSADKLGIKNLTTNNTNILVDTFVGGLETERRSIIKKYNEMLPNNPDKFTAQELDLATKNAKIAGDYVTSSAIQLSRLTEIAKIANDNELLTTVNNYVDKYNSGDLKGNPIKDLKELTNLPEQQVYNLFSMLSTPDWKHQSNEFTGRIDAVSKVLRTERIEDINPVAMKVVLEEFESDNKEGYDKFQKAMDAEQGKVVNYDLISRLKGKAYQYGMTKEQVELLSANGYFSGHIGDVRPNYDIKYGAKTVDLTFNKYDKDKIEDQITKAYKLTVATNELNKLGESGLNKYKPNLSKLSDAIKYHGEEYVKHQKDYNNAVDERDKIRYAMIGEAMKNGGISFDKNSNTVIVENESGEPTVVKLDDVWGATGILNSVRSGLATSVEKDPLPVIAGLVGGVLLSPMTGGSSLGIAGSSIVGTSGLAYAQSKQDYATVLNERIESQMLEDRKESGNNNTVILQDDKIRYMFKNFDKTAKSMKEAESYSNIMLGATMATAPINFFGKGAMGFVTRAGADFTVNAGAEATAQYLNFGKVDVAQAVVSGAMGTALGASIEGGVRGAGNVFSNFKNTQEVNTTFRELDTDTISKNLEEIGLGNDTLRELARINRSRSTGSGKFEQVTRLFTSRADTTQLRVDMIDEKLNNFDFGLTDEGNVRARELIKDLSKGVDEVKATELRTLLGSSKHAEIDTSPITSGGLKSLQQEIDASISKGEAKAEKVVTKYQDQANVMVTDVKEAVIRVKENKYKDNRQRIKDLKIVNEAQRQLPNLAKAIDDIGGDSLKAKSLSRTVNSNKMKEAYLESYNIYLQSQLGKLKRESASFEKSVAKQKDAFDKQVDKGIKEAIKVRQADAEAEVVKLETEIEGIVNEINTIKGLFKKGELPLEVSRDGERLNTNVILDRAEELVKEIINNPINSNSTKGALEAFYTKLETIARKVTRARQVYKYGNKSFKDKGEVNAKAIQTLIQSQDRIKLAGLHRLISQLSDIIERVDEIETGVIDRTSIEKLLSDFKTSEPMSSLGKGINDILEAWEVRLRQPELDAIELEGEINIALKQYRELIDEPTKELFDLELKLVDELKAKVDKAQNDANLSPEARKKILEEVYQTPEFNAFLLKYEEFYANIKGKEEQIKAEAEALLGSYTRIQKFVDDVKDINSGVTIQPHMKGKVIMMKLIDEGMPDVDFDKKMIDESLDAIGLGDKSADELRAELKNITYGRSKSLEEVKQNLIDGKPVTYNDAHILFIGKQHTKKVKNTALATVGSNLRNSSQDAGTNSMVKTIFRQLSEGSDSLDVLSGMNPRQYIDRLDGEIKDLIDNADGRVNTDVLVKVMELKMIAESLGSTNPSYKNAIKEIQDNAWNIIERHQGAMREFVGERADLDKRISDIMDDALEVQREINEVGKSLVEGKDPNTMLDKAVDGLFSAIGSKKSVVAIKRGVKFVLPLASDFKRITRIANGQRTRAIMNYELVAKEYDSVMKSLSKEVDSEKAIRIIEAHQSKYKVAKTQDEVDTTHKELLEDLAQDYYALSYKQLGREQSKMFKSVVSAVFRMTDTIEAMNKELIHFMNQHLDSAFGRVTVKNYFLDRARSEFRKKPDRLKIELDNIRNEDPAVLVERFKADNLFYNRVLNGNYIKQSYLAFVDNKNWNKVYGELGNKPVNDKARGIYQNAYLRLLATKLGRDYGDIKFELIDDVNMIYRIEYGDEKYGVQFVEAKNGQIQALPKRIGDIDNGKVDLEDMNSGNVVDGFDRDFYNHTSVVEKDLMNMIGEARANADPETAFVTILDSYGIRGDNLDPLSFIPQEIQDYLGAIHNPLTNFEQTVKRIGEQVARLEQRVLLDVVYNGIANRNGDLLKTGRLTPDERSKYTPVKVTEQSIFGTKFLEDSEVATGNNENIYYVRNDYAEELNEITYNAINTPWKGLNQSYLGATWFLNTINKFWVTYRPDILLANTIEMFGNRAIMSLNRGVNYLEGENARVGVSLKDILNADKRNTKDTGLQHPTENRVITDYELQQMIFKSNLLEEGAYSKAISDEYIRAVKQGKFDEWEGLLTQSRFEKIKDGAKSVDEMFLKIYVNAERVPKMHMFLNGVVEALQDMNRVKRGNPSRLGTKGEMLETIDDIAQYATDLTYRMTMNMSNASPLIKAITGTKLLGVFPVLHTESMRLSVNCATEVGARIANGDLLGAVKYSNLLLGQVALNYAMFQIYTGVIQGVQSLLNEETLNNPLSQEDKELVAEATKDTFSATASKRLIEGGDEIYAMESFRYSDKFFALELINNITNGHLTPYEALSTSMKSLYDSYTDTSIPVRLVDKTATMVKSDTPFTTDEYLNALGGTWYNSTRRAIGSAVGLTDYDNGYRKNGTDRKADLVYDIAKTLGAPISEIEPLNSVVRKIRTSGYNASNAKYTVINGLVNASRFTANMDDEKLRTEVASLMNQYYKVLNEEAVKVQGGILDGKEVIGYRDTLERVVDMYQRRTGKVLHYTGISDGVEFSMALNGDKKVATVKTLKSDAQDLFNQDEGKSLKIPEIQYSNGRYSMITVRDSSGNDTGKVKSNLGGKISPLNISMLSKEQQQSILKAHYVANQIIKKYRESL